MAKGQEIPVPMRGAIVTLRHVMKLPYGEIGLKTGINEASVKTLYHRIRARSGGPGSSLADLLNNLEDLPRSGRPRVPKAVAPASKPSPVRAYQGRVPFDRTTVVNHTRPSDRSASSCTITNTVPFENAPQLAIEYIPQYPPTTADPILGYTPQYSPAMAAPTPELTASQRETRAYYEAIYNEHRHSIPGYPAQEAHQTAAQETVPEMSQAVASMPMSSSMAQPSNGMLNSRASAGSPTAEQLEDTDDSDLEEELVGLPMESCDVVRRKIRAFLDNGEMKVGEFQNAISTNSKAYSNFMTQNGPYKGSGSSVYQKAWRFFKLRELRGIKPPKHPSKPKKGEEGAAAAAAPNLTAIELPGEMDDKVAIYDTCDEVRRKINAHMKKPGVVQAQFLRDIAASYRKAPRKVQSTQLSKFRSKKGAWEGNTSVVFYGAYVFFEKLRIAEKKPKSKKRLEMEGIYSKEGGVDTTSRHQYFSVLEGQRPYVDPYGRVNIL